MKNRTRVKIIFIVICTLSRANYANECDSLVSYVKSIYSQCVALGKQDSTYPACAVKYKNAKEGAAKGCSRSVSIASGDSIPATTPKQIDWSTVPFEQFIDLCISATSSTSIEMALSSGINPDRQDENGRTALMFAAQEGNGISATTLLRLGANPNIQDETGYTALAYAISHGQNEMTRLLLLWHADPYMETKDSMTPVILALKQNSPEILRVFKNAGIALNETFSGHSLLYWAVLKKDSLLVRILLDNGADPNEKDHLDGKYPLEIAEMTNDSILYQTLLDHGALFNLYPIYRISDSDTILDTLDISELRIKAFINKASYSKQYYMNGVPCDCDSLQIKRQPGLSAQKDSLGKVFLSFTPDTITQISWNGGEKNGLVFRHIYYPTGNSPISPTHPVILSGEEFHYANGIIEGEYISVDFLNYFKQGLFYKNGKRNGIDIEYTYNKIHDDGMIDDFFPFSDSKECLYSNFPIYKIIPWVDGEIDGVVQYQCDVDGTMCKEDPSYDLIYDDKKIVCKEVYYSKGVELGEKEKDDGLLKISEWKDKPGNGIISWYQGDEKHLVKEMTVKNHEADGVCQEFYENGVLKSEGKYKNGQAEGLWQNYFQSGILKSEISYHKDNAEGLFKSYYAEYGTLKMEVTYRNGKRNGIQKDFYKPEENMFGERIGDEGPILVIITPFLNDKINGIQKYFYRSGVLAKESPYKSGELNGTLKEYYPSGHIKSQVSYKKGNATSLKKCYSESGKIIKKGQANIECE